MNAAYAFLLLFLATSHLAGLEAFALVTPGTFGTTARASSMGLRMADIVDFKVTKSEDDIRFPSFQVAFNQRWKATNLDFVYLPRTPEEVAAALDDAVGSGKTVKIRCGGHCYENFVMSDDTTAIIDVTGLQDWGLDKERNAYFLSSGDTNWGAFNKIFKNFGFVLPGGSCYSVGLGGHISGGGDGIMSRKYGLTVDWLTGVEIVVKPDPALPAQVKYVHKGSTNQEDLDLFWASTGGGGGNFGIITKYFFEILPQAPRGAIITNVAFDWNYMTEDLLQKLLDWYVDFASSADNWDSSGKFPIMHKAAGESQMLLHTAYWTEKEKAQAIVYHQQLKDELLALDADPASNLVCAPTTAIAFHGGYWSRPPVPERSGKLKSLATQCKSELAAGTLSKIEETTIDFNFYDATQTMNPSGPNQRGKYKSAYHKTYFTPAMVTAIYQWLTTVPEGLAMEEMKQSLVQVDCFGGMINTEASDVTAIAQRSYVVKLQFQTYWQDVDVDNAHLTWIRGFYEQMYAPYGGTPNPNFSDEAKALFEGCYYNYPDVDLNDIVGAEGALELYFLDNLARLKTAKTTWDKANIFHHAQSIPPQ
ncbi:hypothetical protein ACA910_007612 [Epithemia clementina (nom. ined.)]